MDFFTSVYINITEFFSNFSHALYLNFIKEDRYLMILTGLQNTIFISVCAILAGIILGTVVFFFRRSRFKVIRAIGYVYVDVIRSTPVVTQLFIIYFVIFGFLKGNVAVPLAILGFGINSGAYVSEIIRAGFQSIDIGQVEAGRSLGLSSAKTTMFIVAPQAIKNILPTLANEFIVLVKETAVVGYLAVPDLTRAADFVRSRTYDQYIPLLTAAIIYYIIIKMLTLCLTRFERKLRASERG